MIFFKAPMEREPTKSCGDCRGRSVFFKLFGGGDFNGGNTFK